MLIRVRLVVASNFVVILLSLVNYGISIVAVIIAASQSTLYSSLLEALLPTAENTIAMTATRCNYPYDDYYDYYSYYYKYRDEPKTEALLALRHWRALLVIAAA